MPTIRRRHGRLCDAVAAGKRTTPEQDARWRLAACYTTDNALEATGLIAFGVNAMTDVEQRHVSAMGNQLGHQYNRDKAAPSNSSKCVESAATGTKA